MMMIIQVNNFSLFSFKINLEFKIIESDNVTKKSQNVN